MVFSVGVLYSSQTLLQIVGRGDLQIKNFRKNFARIEVADANTVLATSQKCRWILVENDGSISLTERGAYLVDLPNEKLRLREQLLDLIVADPPPWARRLIQGRFEALKAMPDSAQQCFRDCGLTRGTNDEIVGWWDRASQSVRTERSKVNHEVGRTAEKLTLNFERGRTGKEPTWQAVETSVSGYDVLSFVEGGSSKRLKIEVKGSSMRRSEAYFFITRNEWRTAENSHFYQFHLWLVHQLPVLFIIPAEDLKTHVPTDGKTGRWEIAQLFFKNFTDYETSEI